MAQNNLVVAGIDVAKDKVDVCLRAPSLRRTFASTAEGRRELTTWFRRQKVGKAVMEASGGIVETNAELYAETEVDVISIGALTHSSRALDLSQRPV